MAEKSIDECRKEIEKINSDILLLLKKRFVLTRQIGEIKKNSSVNVSCKDIEDKIISDVLKENDGFLNEQFLKELYTLIFKYSKEEQEKTGLSFPQN